MSGCLLISLGWRNFCEESLTGGLGGDGGSLSPFALSFLAALPVLAASLTVELDEEDVRDSRTDARPFGSSASVSISLGKLPARRLVRGGLVKDALCWRVAR